MYDTKVCVSCSKGKARIKLSLKSIFSCYGSLVSTVKYLNIIIENHLVSVESANEITGRYLGFDLLKSGPQRTSSAFISFEVICVKPEKNL